MGNNQTISDMLAAYWNMVINKSGSICMAGTAGGAANGTAQTPLIEALGDYGTALGLSGKFWTTAEIFGSIRRTTLIRLHYH